LQRKEFDIAIIGAGIAGAGVAAALGSDKSIAIIEMESRPGYHSTGRSAALFAMNYGNAPIRQLNRASWPMFHNMPSAYFPHALLTKRGVLHIANSENVGELDALLAEASDIEEIDIDQALSLVPIINRDVCVKAAYEPDAMDIDVAALHQGYLKQAKVAGAEIICDAKATAISHVDGRWEIGTPSGSIAADIIVNAAGAWADEVAKLAGVSPVGVQPKRRSMATLPSPSPEQSHSWPMLLSASEDWYMKPDAGSFLVSPADEDPVEPHDAFVDDMVLAEGLHRFCEATTYDLTHIEGSWAGLRVFVTDKTPVCGYAETDGKFFWLAGQGGYGIQTAPALSVLAASMILGEDLPEFADAELVGALSPNRNALKNKG
jgi:D-arginine dehydrogenase